MLPCTVLEDAALYFFVLQVYVCVCVWWGEELLLICTILLPVDIILTIEPMNSKIVFGTAVLPMYM